MMGTVLASGSPAHIGYPKDEVVSARMPSCDFNFKKQQYMQHTASSVTVRHFAACSTGP
jgi:hypothetical protein